jgi:hypothetical protein
MLIQYFCCHNNKWEGSAVSDSVVKTAVLLTLLCHSGREGHQASLLYFRAEGHNNSGLKSESSSFTGYCTRS